jgi:periplasmic protein TonB
MATRAFLLCGDEKAVQAVTQILDELEVSFEHSSEPAFSLKRLATQKFDLLIVDCDNAQNATQVFNSARASNLNKTSIAIAIVEGKAGVPNAFRLGASLVLTKPVALEQVRNTVRTGIGMTRKEAQETKPPVIAPVLATPNSITPPVPAPRVVPTPAVLTPVAPAPTPKPAVTSAPVAEKPVTPPRPTPAPLVQEYKPALTNFTEPKPEPQATASATAKAETAASPVKNFDSIFATPTTPLPEKESKKAHSDKPQTKEAAASTSPTLTIVDPLAEEDSFDPAKDEGVPSFGGKPSFAGLEQSEGGRGKGALIAAVVVLVLGGASYGAWLTVPGFHDFVAGQYLNASSKVATLRGQPQPVAAAKPPAPAPAPVAAPAQPVAAPGAATPDATSNPASSTEPGAPGAAADTNAANPMQPPAPTTDTPEQKAATVQPAKQDGAHPANPALVPASLPNTAPAAKAPSNELTEVPEDFADDQIVHRVRPTYPKQARARKLHGTVVLQAIVNKQGKVDSLQLVSGDPLLAQAAADAIKQWRYKPYWHNGEITDFQTRVTIDFKVP